jgi:MFS-type transporter involved in bile tolerance (Atg22 family)
MKLRSLLIYLLILLSLIPVWSVSRSLQKILRPRESAGRLFLFFLANFILVIIYTILVVGLVVGLFRR